MLTEHCRTASQSTFIRTRVHKPWKKDPPDDCERLLMLTRAWFNYDRREIWFKSVSRFSKQMRTWGWTPREIVHYLLRPLEWISHVVASADQDKGGVTVWECLWVCVCVSKCVNEEDVIQAPLHAHLTWPESGLGVTLAVR